MLSRLIGTLAVDRLFLLGYSVLAIGLPFNKVVLSISSMLIFLLLLLEINPKRDWERIKASKVIQLLLVFLVLHLLSFFWSENTADFLKDFNSKLPFYSIPLVFVVHPLKDEKQIKVVLACFLTSITAISLLNFISYYGWRKTSYDDVRTMSLFLSHIRFGLMLVFGMVVCAWWFVRPELKLKFLPVLGILWFLVYTYFAEVFSAYVAIAGVVLVALFWFLFQQKKRWLAYSSMALILTASVSALVLLLNFFSEQEGKPVLSQLEKRTAEGNLYEHDLSTNYYINGTHVYSYVCGPELNREWEQVSNLSLLDTNKQGYIHYYILIQYMTSKKLRKDAAGFKQLTKQDIRNIENGISSYRDESEGFFTRLKTLRSEFYDNDPNGKTILQRFEYIKAGWEIFKRNSFFGVGSGDLQDEFKQQYRRSESKLKEENRLRAHNQFLTYFISFGFLGGLLFLVLIAYSIYFLIRRNSLPGVLFLTIVVISFLSEDTLETQMGGTFFALFFGLFISSTSFLKSKPDGH